MKRPAPPRNPYLLPLLGVLAAAVLFTLVALLAPDDWGASSPPQDDDPGIEVDVDVHHPHATHPRARYSPQARRSPAPRRTRTVPTGTVPTRLAKVAPRR